MHGQSLPFSLCVCMMRDNLASFSALSFLLSILFRCMEKSPQIGFNLLSYVVPRGFYILKEKVWNKINKVFIHKLIKNNPPVVTFISVKIPKYWKIAFSLVEKKKKRVY